MLMRRRRGIPAACAIIPIAAARNSERPAIARPKALVCVAEAFAEFMWICAVIFAGRFMPQRRFLQKQGRSDRDFMITVIGEKYRALDTSFGWADVHAFFIRPVEQYDNVASRSDSTVQRIKHILVCTLAENAYLDNNRADRLNPVLFGSVLEARIRANGDNASLIAFNCLSWENKDHEQFE